MTMMTDYGRLWETIKDHQWQWKTINDYQTIYQKITSSC